VFAIVAVTEHGVCLSGMQQSQAGKDLAGALGHACGMPGEAEPGPGSRLP